jgi:hypothetical protein
MHLPTAPTRKLMDKTTSKEENDNAFDKYIIIKA